MGGPGSGRKKGGASKIKTKTNKELSIKKIDSLRRSLQKEIHTGFGRSSKAEKIKKTLKDAKVPGFF